MPEPDPRAKILPHAEVDRWLAAQRAAGRRIGFTCGAFDILHAGHVHYLSRARTLCDRLIVAVNSDASIRRYKDPLRPINPEQQRMYVVAGLAPVDAVTLLDEDRPLSLLLRWKPEIYLKGGDYSAGSLRSAEAVRGYGGAVEVIATEFSTSTSRILERAAHAPAAPAPAAHARGLILLDRDGTLIRDIPFLHDPARVEVLPGAADGLAQLQAAGFLMAIVSNQQGIGLGYYTTQDFIAVNQVLLRELARHGIRISRIYHCPHSLADACTCRKPAAGMLDRALEDFRTPPGACFLIGDTQADMEAGAAAGCHTVYLGTAPETPCEYLAADLPAAAAWILASA